MSEIQKIVWTNSAKDQLKTIFNYYKERSLQGANNVKDDILNAAKKINFSEQFQKDEIEPEYRRIIVREIVFIVKIFSLKRDSGAQL